MPSKSRLESSRFKSAANASPNGVADKNLVLFSTGSKFDILFPEIKFLTDDDRLTDEAV